MVVQFWCYNYDSINLLVHHNLGAGSLLIFRTGDLAQVYYQNLVIDTGNGNDEIYPELCFIAFVKSYM